MTEPLAPLRIADLSGLRVAVWGCGREGLAALELLRCRNVELTLLDDRPVPEAVVRRLGEVELWTGEDVAPRLGEFDVIVKSPGVSRYREDVRRAAAEGVRFTSGTRLWLAEHQGATTVAITGTKGKSTTASLLAHMLAASGLQVELCGNIGRPLLDLMGERSDEASETKPRPDIWVLELSSYQTADLDVWPAWAVLLNLHPEHLDWHDHSLVTYYADKANLFAGLERGRGIVNALDAEARAAVAAHSPRLFNDRGGFHVRQGAIWLRDRRLTGELPLRGRHNLENACAALTVARALEVDVEPCVAALPSFRGLPHRLQVLGEKEGLVWVDDSISTIPQSALAAIEAFRGSPLTLLLGGFDRGVDFAPLAEGVVAGNVHAVVAMPESGERLLAAIREAGAAAGGARPELHSAADLAEAVEVAREATPAGGTVLLSPAAASYGAFSDYAERGRRFASLAGFSPPGG